MDDAVNSLKIFIVSYDNVDKKYSKIYEVYNKSTILYTIIVNYR